MSKLHNAIKTGEPFANKKLAVREVGRSHLVIIGVTLLSLFLMLNSTYDYIDIGGQSVRGYAVTICALLVLMVGTSTAIAVRAYGALKK